MRIPCHFGLTGRGMVVVNPILDHRIGVRGGGIFPGFGSDPIEVIEPLEIVKSESPHSGSEWVRIPSDSVRDIERSQPDTQGSAPESLNTLPRASERPLGGDTPVLPHELDIGESKGIGQRRFKSCPQPGRLSCGNTPGASKSGTNNTGTRALA